MTLLLASLAVLLIGPLIGLIGGRRGLVLAGMDGLVLAGIVSLVLVELGPEAFAALGWGAVFAIGIGFFLPGLIEKRMSTAAKRAHNTALVLVITGLVIHAIADGIALALPQQMEHGDQRLGLAVVMHRLPAALTVWWLLRTVRGGLAAGVALSAIGVATVVGYAYTPLLSPFVNSMWIEFFLAFIAGSLLHVVIHRVPQQDQGHSRRSLRSAGAVGALIGLGMMALVPGGHAVGGAHAGHGAVHDELLPTLLMLAGETAPALLIAYAAAGLLEAFVPATSLAWLSRGNRLTQATKGMAFGLPLPVCSCGVIPLYQSLARRGVPPTAGMAFLIATPELGLDALLISLPLLGQEFTLVRVGAAAVVALLVGTVVGSMTSAIEAPEAAVDTESGSRSVAERIRRGLRTGFVDVLDDTLPWILLGLLIAGALGPAVEVLQLTNVPGPLQVVLFAMVGMPTYVCASGATPMVAVLLMSGVSPGAGLAFLLTGPATNATTFGVLSSLHGRRVAFAFAGVVVAGTVALGIAVDALMPTAASAALDMHAHEGSSPVQLAAIAALSLLGLWSLFRLGPRGMLAKVIQLNDHHHNDGEGGNEGTGEASGCCAADDPAPVVASSAESKTASGGCCAPEPPPPPPPTTDEGCCGGH